MYTYRHVHAYKHFLLVCGVFLRIFFFPSGVGGSNTSRTDTGPNWTASFPQEQLPSSPNKRSLTSTAIDERITARAIGAALPNLISNVMFPGNAIRIERVSA